MLASVMTGMRFLNAINQSHNFSVSQESKSDNESILQHPKNREYLEKQGYYTRHGDKKTGSPTKTGSTAEEKFIRLSKAMSLDASERRKKFHQTRSRNLSLLEQSSTEDQSSSKDDRKHAMTSRSFTSIDNSDSFDSAEHNEGHDDVNADVFMHDDDDIMFSRPCVSLGDISPGLMLKRSMFSQESNLQSSDEVIESEDAKQAMVPRTRAYNEGLQKIAHLRKNQVDRFMVMQDDDEDYVVSPTGSPSLSKESSLEHTLTSSDLHRLKKKSSTLKADSTCDDAEVTSQLSAEREVTPVSSPRVVKFRLNGESEDGENVAMDTHSDKNVAKDSVDGKDVSIDTVDRKLDMDVIDRDLNSNVSCSRDLMSDDPDSFGQKIRYKDAEVSLVLTYLFA